MTDGRMFRYPGGSLVITERFRILNEHNDFPDAEAAELVAAVMSAMDAAEEAYQIAEFEGAASHLVHAAALLVVMVDGIVLNDLQLRLESGEEYPPARRIETVRLPEPEVGS